MSTNRTTGLAGVLVGAASILTVPLYFVYSGPPPVWVVLTRDLITIIAGTGMLVFFTGLRRLLRDDLTAAAGLVLTTIILVADALEAGTVIGYQGPAIDPTTTGPLAHGAILLHGSVGRAITVVLLVSAASAIRRTEALPRFTATLGYAIAAANLAFVPSLYFGADAARFYSALGWGNTAMTASFIAWWITAVGVVLARRGDRPALAQPAAATV